MFYSNLSPWEHIKVKTFLITHSVIKTIKIAKYKYNTEYSFWNLFSINFLIYSKIKDGRSKIFIANILFRRHNKMSTYYSGGIIKCLSWLNLINIYPYITVFLIIMRAIKKKKRKKLKLIQYNKSIFNVLIERSWIINLRSLVFISDKCVP